MAAVGRCGPGRWLPNFFLEVGRSFSGSALSVCLHVLLIFSYKLPNVPTAASGCPDNGRLELITEESLLLSAWLFRITITVDLYISGSCEKMLITLAVVHNSVKILFIHILAES